MPDPTQTPGQGVTPAVAAPDINNMNVQPEELPSLADYAREPSQGAWPKDWYKAQIIEGYATGSGYQWETHDAPSKDGTSRNMTVCFALTNSAGETRNIWVSFNYRLDDFTAQKLNAIIALRKQYAGKRGAWAEKDLQRSSLAIAQLGQFERALGFRFQRTPAGFLKTSVFVGQKMDVRLTINEEEFNEVAEFARLGDRTDKKGK